MISREHIKSQAFERALKRYEASMDEARMEYRSTVDKILTEIKKEKINEIRKSFTEHE